MMTNKINKQTLVNIVNGAMRSCLNDHPNSIHPDYFTSLRKRVVNQLVAHLKTELK